MLHENICESRKLSTVSYQAEVLYYRVLTQVDDNGNFFYDPNIIKGRCFPRRKDATPKKIETWLRELAKTSVGESSLLSTYEHDGEKFIHFNKFEDFQYLRSDLKPDVRYPVHPSKLGPAPAQKRIEAATPTYTGSSRISNETVDANQSKVNTNQVRNVTELVCESQNAEELFDKAKRMYRRIIGNGFGSLGQRKREWSGLVSKYGGDSVLAGVEKCAREKTSFLKGSEWPLAFFLKNAAEYIEAAKTPVENASDPDRGVSTDVSDIRPPDYDETISRTKEKASA